KTAVRSRTASSCGGKRRRPGAGLSEVFRRVPWSIADCRLPIADRRIVDCRLSIDALSIADWIGTLSVELTSQSTLANPSIADRQSVDRHSAIGSRHSVTLPFLSG